MSKSAQEQLKPGVIDALDGIAIPKVGSLQHDTGGGWRVIRESKTH